MKKERAFNNWKPNSVHLNFPNGNLVSMIWGADSYTENRHKLFREIAPSPQEESDFTAAFNTFMESDTVEVMVDCSEELLKKLCKRFTGGNPFGYLSIMDWLYIVNEVAKEKTKVK